MIVINRTKLQEVIAGYKKYFPEHISDEIYKWKAVKHFQEVWDIDAQDFAAMFWEATSKFDNLLASPNHFPRKMVKSMYESEPETVREMFRDLYDESKPLRERVDNFRANADRIKRQHWPDKMHYQNFNVISTYLWARYPDKYYIYKYKEIRVITRTLESSYVVKKGADTPILLQSIEFFDLLRAEIQKDPDIRPMLNSVLTPDCYQDKNLNGIVNDLNFYASRYFNFSEGKKTKEQKEILEKSIVPNTSCNYFWLCANPSVWSMTDWSVGEEQAYTLLNENGNKRRIFHNFIDATAGDRVICYEANPTKQVTALAIVSKANDGERLWFEKVESLTVPIPFATIKENIDLQKMEFLVNPNGSFFKLTKEEYDLIMDIIRESNKGANSEAGYEKYSREDFLDEVFISEKNLTDLETLLKNKKNIILQGAPGVGKTFCARRLAYVMMGEKDESRVSLIQFHQNYSYEDFVLGYKPSGADFELQRGIFYKFCINAANNPNKDYFFIIDEINRGNLSKIFGELLMLIEKDYRGEKLTLAYKDEKFFVPKNVYLIGMMNTADRSLAMIDYALRRRFCFYDMRPGFRSEGFRKYQEVLSYPRFNRLIEKVEELNQVIAKDDLLGTGFELGHSYFCGQKSVNDTWLRQVINYEILPTLQEYWFDNRSEVEKWEGELNSIFND